MLLFLQIPVRVCTKVCTCVCKYVPRNLSRCTHTRFLPCVAEFTLTKTFPTLEHDVFTFRSTQTPQSVLHQSPTIHTTRLDILTLFTLPKTTTRVVATNSCVFLRLSGQEDEFNQKSQTYRRRRHLVWHFLAQPRQCLGSPVLV